MLAAEIFSGVRAYFLLLPDDAMPEYAAGELAVLYCRAERVGWKTAAGSSGESWGGRFLRLPQRAAGKCGVLFPE